MRPTKNIIGRAQIGNKKEAEVISHTIVRHADHVPITLGRLSDQKVALFPLQNQLVRGELGDLPMVL